MSVSRAEVLSLYRSLLREACKFSNYNYRMYCLRRVRDAFYVNKSLTDPKKVEEVYSHGYRQLQVIQRQVIIGNLYKTDALVIEKISNKPSSSQLT